MVTVGFQTVLLLFLTFVTSQCQESFLANLIGSTREFLGVPTDLVKDTRTFDSAYDFIIVGAGSGGSVLANRLTEVPEWNVLLLEAGRDEIALTDIPLASTFWTFTDFNWGYKSVPQKNICMAMKENRCTWPRGKCMGGTSVLNYLVYTRGNSKDYDEWEQLGNPGWGYQDVLQYFIKAERTEIPNIKDSPFRGRDGYLNVEHSPYRTPLAEAFVAAGPEFGYEINDPNGEKQMGFSYVQATMKNGRRVSASKAYIRPVRNRPNLHVAKYARVTRILIDPLTNSTYGVEFVKNRKTHVARATREVLLSAGALNTPQLLMLSGVGPEEHLRELGIPVIKNVPYVGENLQDHVSFGGLIFLVNESVSIVDSRVAANPLNAINFLVRNRGPLTLAGGAEGLAFINTRNNDTNDVFPYDEDVPDIELVIGAGSLSGDTSGALRESFGLRPELYKAMFRQINGRDGYSIVPILMKPRSRGRIRLKSKNPYHWPLFHPGYYSDEVDLRTIVRGIRATPKYDLQHSLELFKHYATNQICYKLAPK